MFDQTDDELDGQLLNIFEIETENGTKHFVGFIDPATAEAHGIDSRCLIGDFTPLEDGEFDVHTFQVNPDFIEAFTEYMNGDPSQAEDVISHALTIPGEALYIVDPRNKSDPQYDPPSHDVMGAFRVDSTGQVVANSFEYHAEYEWFSTASGVSGLLEDRRFYEWLHGF